MITREQVVNAIDKLPPSFTVDDLLDKLILMQKIEIGLAQSVKGETHSTEEARKLLGKWFE